MSVMAGMSDGSTFQCPTFQYFLSCFALNDQIYIRNTIKAILMGKTLPKYIRLTGDVGKSTLIYLIQYLAAIYGQGLDPKCSHNGSIKTYTDRPIIIANSKENPIPNTNNFKQFQNSMNSKYIKSNIDIQICCFN
jgi:hypothetical protein